MGHAVGRREDEVSLRGDAAVGGVPKVVLSLSDLKKSVQANSVVGHE